MMNHPAINAAIDYLKGRNYPIPPEALSILPREKLTRENRAELAVSIKAGTVHSRALKALEYQVVRDRFWSVVYEAVQLYLSLGGSPTQYRNAMKQGIAEAWNDAADIGYTDGGGTLPMDDETQEWVASEQAAQLAYADSFFATLRDLRREGDYDDISEAFSAAERWSSSLDGFYNAVKLAGARNVMLTWGLGNTEKHCATCSKLDGQRHRASWFTSRGYYPRKPGSATDCGGYHCDCGLFTDDGEEFTI